MDGIIDMYSFYNDLILIEMNEMSSQLNSLSKLTIDFKAHIIQKIRKSLKRV